MSPFIPSVVAVGCGGALGAVLRYAMGVLAVRQLGLPAWPATLIVNCLGCLAIGFLFGWLESQHRQSWLHPLLVPGLLGGFTTFSAFGLEAMQMLQAQRVWAALGYVAASVVLGLLAVKAGMLFFERIM